MLLPLLRRCYYRERISAESELCDKMYQFLNEFTNCAEYIWLKVSFYTNQQWMANIDYAFFALNYKYSYKHYYGVVFIENELL